MSDKILDRYAAALHSNNLSVDADTTYSDSDVLGAMGIAGRREPLAVGLYRLIMGDNHAAHEIVEIVADMVWREARRVCVRLSMTGARYMAQKCLAWFRDSTCKACSGQSQGLDLDAKIGLLMLGAGCQECGSTGRILLERHFHQDHKELAKWVVSVMEHKLSRAGPAAMKALAPRLRLGNDAG
jgi:hypothetical protein